MYRRTAPALLALLALLTGLTFLASPAAQATHAQCHDGLDNDGDGLADYPADGGCFATGDNSESPNAVCSDGIDNDSDGFADFPTDPGCSSPQDTSEGCTNSLVDGVVLCVSQGPEEERYGIDNPTPGTEHTIVAYLETYRFTVGTTSVTVPCVRLVADSIDVSPCAQAGGNLESSSALVSRSVDEPIPSGPTPLVEVAICHGELEATVFGFGLNSQAILTVCT